MRRYLSLRFGERLRFPSFPASWRLRLAHKLGLIGLIAFLLAGFNLAFVKLVMDDGRSMAGVVSAAGKLRMLSRKIEIDVMEYIRFPQQGTEAVRNGMAEFEQLLQAVADGGQFFGAQVPPMNDWHRHFLDAVRRGWILYRVDIEAILAAGPDAHTGHRPLAPEGLFALQRQFAGRATGLLHACEELIASILRDLETHQQQTAVRMLGAIGLLVVALIAMLLLAYRNFSGAVARLHDDVQRIALGDYQVRRYSRPTDELAELSQAFDAAMRKVGASLEGMRRSHQALQQTDRIFRGLADIPGLGVFSVIDRRLSFANQHVADMLGYESAAPLLDMSVQMLFPSPSCRRFWDENPPPGVDGLPFEARCPARHRDGRQIMLKIKGVRRLQGEHTFAVCLVRLATAKEGASEAQ